MAFHLPLSRHDLAGGMGDAGVLLPLAIAAVTLNHLNPVVVFGSAGLFYILAAIYFKAPVPVQPLKALTALVIASGASQTVVTAAALLFGGALLIIAFTGLASKLGRLFTLPVIRGIQLGLGFILVSQGVRLVLDPRPFSGFAPVVWPLGSSTVGAGLFIGVAALLLLLGLLGNRRIPATLVLLGGGLLAGLAVLGPPVLHPFSLELTPIGLPSVNDFLLAGAVLVLPQLPLTLGNAVVAAAQTGRSYFPQAGRLTPRNLAASMGMANIGIGALGGLPLCHGAGGFTAHYRLGARSAWATASYGALLITSVLVAGASISALLALIPLAVLGVLLIYVGIEHALLIKDLVDSREGLAIALVTAATSFALDNNLAFGFGAGLALTLLLRIKARHASHSPEQEETLEKPLLKPPPS